MIKSLLGVVLVLLAGSAGPAGQGKRIPPADADFLAEAASMGLMELKLGKMTSEVARNDDVKRFGELLVRDHSENKRALEDLAASKGVDLPRVMTERHQAVVNKLAKLTGAEYEDEFLRRVIAAHVSAIAKYEGETKSGGDTDVQAFATRTLPTLQQHLRTARELAEKHTKK